ncbi:unnamed protein product, partial [Prorocentrum cordatum]
ETATSPVAARAAHAAIIGPARRAGRAPGREGARPRVAREQAQGRQDQEPAHDLRGRGVRELLQQARVRVQGGRPGSFRVVAGSGHDAARHVLGRQREYLDRRGPGRRGRRLQAGPEGHPRDGGVRGLRGRRRLRRRVVQRRRVLAGRHPGPGQGLGQVLRGDGFESFGPAALRSFCLPVLCRLHAWRFGRAHTDQPRVQGVPRKYRCSCRRPPSATGGGDRNGVKAIFAAVATGHCRRLHQYYGGTKLLSPLV